MKIYETPLAALAAATRYRLRNGGSIVRGGRGEDVGDEGKIVGTYDFVAVVKNPTAENPLGDSWEEFPYNYAKTE